MSHANADTGDDRPTITTICTFNATKAPRIVKDGFAVYPDALLFKVGNYPDKNYSMDAGEMDAAVASFTPISGNIEHSTFLKGRACHVKSIRVDTKNAEFLRGEVHIPLGLDQILEDGERKVSCEWNKKTKQLTGMALTVNPRVTEASLISSFSAWATDNPDDPESVEFKKDRTYEGQRMLQTIHDRAAEAGAVCQDDSAFSAFTTTLFHSSLELQGIQKLHDASCEGGAKCRMMSKEEMDKRGAYFANIAMFTPKKKSEHADSHHQLIHDVIGTGYPGACTGGPMTPTGAMTGAADTAAMSDSTEQIKALKTIHTMTTEHGACCPGKAKMSETRPAGITNPLARFKMSKFANLIEAIGKIPDQPTDADFLAVFRAAPRELIETVAKEVPADPLAAFADNPHFLALKKRTEIAEATLEANRVKDATANAANFATAQAARLLLNGDLSSLLEAVLFSATEIDRSSSAAVVAFSQAGEAKTAKFHEAVRLFVEKLPDNPMGKQILDADGNLPAEFKVLPNGSTKKSAAEDAEERRTMLSKTTAGQAVLAREDAARNSK